MSGKEWFIERYRELGSNITGNETTFQTLRINSLKTTEKKLVNILINLGVKLEKIPFLDYGYKVLDSPFSLGSSIEYLLGMYSLQEAASQYPVQVLNPTHIDKVLDMASAPGGKTTQAAAYMNNESIIVSTDINRDRLYATENNVERCGVKNVSIHNIDALHLPEKPLFTKILLDAPCSGNYVTDSNWFEKRTAQDIKRNASLQRLLLSKAVELLDHRGILVYSTCSLEPEENEFNIQWLLDNKDVELERIYGPGKSAITEFDNISLDEKVGFCMRFWPDQTGTQGFFIAKVLKK